MIKCFNSKMCGLAVILMLIVGCSAEFHMDSREVSRNKEGLAVQIAAAESEVEGLTLELAEAKICRDKFAVQADNSIGFWQKENANNKLDHANFDVRVIARRLTSAKEWLATLKATKNARQSDSVGSGTQERVQTSESCL